MSKLAGITAIVLAASLSSCATPYQAQILQSGGFSEQELESGLWRVRFEGNTGTTEETVQTFWLYRCAELALQKGFDGFAILSPIRLTSVDGDWVGANVQLLRVQFLITPPSSSPKLEGDIRLLKNPIRSEPPRIFDAKTLKAALEPHVNGMKCMGQNICAHTHDYLDSPT